MVQSTLSFEGLPASVVELHNKVDTLANKLSTLFQEKEAQTEKLLSAAEACKVFVPAISRLTLIRWTKADLLKEHRIGGRVYYKQSEIIASAIHLQKYKTKIGAEEGINPADKKDRHESK